MMGFSKAVNQTPAKTWFGSAVGPQTFGPPIGEGHYKLTSTLILKLESDPSWHVIMSQIGDGPILRREFKVVQ